MKNLYSKIVFIFALFIISISCSDDNDNNNAVDNSIESNFVVMTNSSDPLITQYSSDGTQIDFFGQRDENGVPLLVDQIYVNEANNTTIYKLDETGRPLKILAQNGTQFEFNWISEQKAVLTILSSDGLNQINTDIDFTETSEKSSVINTKKSNRNNRSISVKYREVNFADNFKSALSDKANCDISVSSCGGAIDADVSVVVKEKSGELLSVFPTHRVNKGQYSASIPTDIAPTINAADICSNIVSVLNASCIIDQVPGLPVLLCAKVSAALTATGVGAPVAAAIITACTTVTTGMTIYCKTLGASTAPGAPSLADKICKADVLNRTFTEDIEIYARASAIPNNALSETAIVSESNSFPISLNINMSSETTIRRLTLEPAAPAQGQDYVSICDIFCLVAGTSVKISVVGTDGYTDSLVYPITSIQPQQEGEFTLVVPGADAGVRDVITLEVTLPNGSTLTRTASLVFS